jgi:hypothetical protein
MEVLTRSGIEPEPWVATAGYGQEAPDRVERHGKPGRRRNAALELAVVKR